MHNSPFNWLCLDHTPIFTQLQIEEALLRNTNDNFLITNIAPREAIVLGVSRQLDTDVHVATAQQDQIPIIKRYSGGGSVFLDENSLIITWIVNSEQTMPSSKELFDWTQQIYSKLFPNTFAIRENDYTLENKKIGGNAQYIQKNRWVHHTSFLWDFDPNKLARYLPLPQTQPIYRQQRSHLDFLTGIHSFFASKQQFLALLLQEITSSYSLLKVQEAYLKAIISKPHRQGTKRLI